MNMNGDEIKTMEINQIINNDKFYNELLERTSDKLANLIYEKSKSPKFDGGRIPLARAAEIMNKNPMFVRKGIESGKIPIGCITQGEGKNMDIYISPKLFYEFTGYIYESGDIKNKID